ncbi:hypothetical protein GCM10023170_030390 [Phytohabitans houttuyneae]|uniref:Uncharacterized protein n=1 Tax=Phytohabitans houttuyneae TaxID=1076126 RepID=A0A6V8JZ06_9ACTN|nr:hypothetical protein Phou_021820 [Phytohabitans houttuyneae]
MTLVGLPSSAGLDGESDDPHAAAPSRAATTERTAKDRRKGTSGSAYGIRTAVLIVNVRRDHAHVNATVLKYGVTR